MHKSLPDNIQIVFVYLPDQKKEMNRKMLTSDFFFQKSCRKDGRQFDHQFLELLQKILNENLTRPDFNAELFSTLAGMSRMQLHRKLTRLTGLTTSAFICKQRLRIAQHLLENSALTISEIAYSTGFNSPSYFIKRFKEIYKRTPANFLKT